ncbi:DNA-J related domain-containing protein [Litoribrevibacter euphylliae]|uniref:DNA-J related domain-containing protein n=1 Tax=Litoribrevibacter euphylliae TaxID=1834034 RepID=A0ABV7HE21_9GAMM
MSVDQSFWNQKRIQELMQTIDAILDHHPEGLSLYELIKTLSSPDIAFFDERPLAEPQGLFQTNFVVMNALYQLNKDKPNHHYEIHSLKVCKHPNQSNSHSTDITEVDPLEIYYLDWANFNQSEQEINELINHFWERMLVIDFEDGDLQTLDLIKPVTLAEIKQQYRKLSQQHHPDKGGDAEYFVEIQQAYTRLTNR